MEELGLSLRPEEQRGLGRLGEGQRHKAGRKEQEQSKGERRRVPLRASEISLVRSVVRGGKAVRGQTQAV